MIQLRPQARASEKAPQVSNQQRGDTHCFQLPHLRVIHYTTIKTTNKQTGISFLGFALFLGGKCEYVLSSKASKKAQLQEMKPRQTISLKESSLEAWREMHRAEGLFQAVGRVAVGCELTLAPEHNFETIFGENVNQTNCTIQGPQSAAEMEFLWLFRNFREQNDLLGTLAFQLRQFLVIFLGVRAEQALGTDCSHAPC